jgi:hypothetical protein
MYTKQINDIIVKGHTDLSPSADETKAVQINFAKQLLKDNGYFVDNLWQTEDVKMNYHCTEEEAQEVLEKALNYESVYELVWEGISYEAEDMNLKRRD